jgi:nicotinate-nucleotide adenylyltransferase
MNIGLYFGSFNPIHNGHLVIASYIKQYTTLNQVWMVVTPQNPLKKNNTLLNEYQRLELVRLSIEGENNIKVTDIEFNLPKPSYTINTLTYLKEKYPQHTFSLIMGSDSLRNIDKWKNGSFILDNYTIYVYERPGFEIKNENIGKNVIICKAPMLEISATMLRQMIEEGKSIRYLVPEKVQEEIEKYGYYKTNPKK